MTRNNTSAPQGVQFMGKVDDSVKVDLMTRAHILLFTAVREGWGLIITEANARGTPVIAYDVPGVRDVVVSGQNGLLVEPDNVQEMARLSCVLLEDHARRMRLTKSAIDFAR